MAEQDNGSGLDSFGRKLLSLFIKDEPKAASPAPAAPQTPAAPSPAPAPTPVQAAPATAPEGSVDNRFVDHFASVLAKANPPGPDYFEFREALKNLANLDLPEDKQYQAAWASFKALGGAQDVAALSNSANQYLTALNNDHEAFVKTVDETITEKVGGLTNEQKQLQTENEQIARQMAELQRKVDANNDRLAKIGGELGEQRQKIESSKSNYEATLAVFVGQIKRDLLKLGEYVK